MTGNELMARLKRMGEEEKEQFKHSLNHGRESDEQFLIYYIEQPALQARVCRFFGVLSQAEKVAAATISAPRRDRIAIYVAAGSMVLAVIAILISLYK